MKLTKDLIGKKLRLKDWASLMWAVPEFVLSNGYFVGVDRNKDTCVFYDECDWELYTEPKKTIIKRMAPALGQFDDKEYFITGKLYSSIDEAIKDNAAFTILKFPANDNLWCEVEVEEE